MNLQFRFVYFCINIDYRGIMILHELSQCDSSNSLCVWFCILIGYRVIVILHELSLNDSSILLCVILCSVCMILYLYHDSACDSSTTLCVWFCIHIGYRGYHDSLNSQLSSAEGGIKTNILKGDIIIGGICQGGCKNWDNIQRG